MAKHENHKPMMSGMPKKMGEGNVMPGRRVGPPASPPPRPRRPASPVEGPPTGTPPRRVPGKKENLPGMPEYVGHPRPRTPAAPPPAPPRRGATPVNPRRR